MLTKDYRRTPIPPVPGSPEIPARAAYTVCQQKPAPGRWVETCVRWDPPVPAGGGAVLIPPGAQLITYGSPELGTYGWYFLVCTSKWVTTGKPGPTVCTSYPAQPYVPAVPPSPARVEMTPYLEWNAGANSVDSQPGACACTFTMGRVGGVVIGLTASLEDVAPVDRLTHALYFHGGRYQVLESGSAKTSDATYAPGDEFQIRRYGGKVTYLHGGRQVYESRVASTGDIHVGTAMYLSGDSIE